MNFFKFLLLIPPAPIKKISFFLKSFNSFIKLIPNFHAGKIFTILYPRSIASLKFSIFDIPGITN